MMRFVQFLLIFGHLKITCHHHTNFQVKFLGSRQMSLKNSRNQMIFRKYTGLEYRFLRKTCTGLRQVYRCQKYPSIDTGTGTGQAKKTCPVWSCTSFHSGQNSRYESLRLFYGEVCSIPVDIWTFENNMSSSYKFLGKIFRFKTNVVEKFKKSDDFSKIYRS